MHNVKSSIVQEEPLRRIGDKVSPAAHDSSDLVVITPGIVDSFGI